VLPAGGDPEPFLVTPFQERAAAFSPDGRWLAYVSDESGQDEVYVQPYPGPGPQFTVSTAGGREPVWSPDGSELFYRTQDQLMVVAVEPGDTFRGDTPRPLFADPYVRDPSVVGAPNYDIMPDGQRFVMVSANTEGDEGLAVILVTNWFEEIRQRIGN
jgi:serine/threonine-protein kinase